MIRCTGLILHSPQFIIAFGLVTFASAQSVTNQTCSDKILPGYSIYRGSIVAAERNLSSQTDCCALCHGDMKDECLAWEWIDQNVDKRAKHNCDIMASVGPPEKFSGRTSGITSAAPPAPAPGPSAPTQPCQSDADCEALWNTANWRCLEHKGAKPSPLNNCHMHATTKNTTCACLPSTGCHGGALLKRATQANTTTNLLVIGDSISLGMKSELSMMLRQDGWSLYHNPGNGDNTNYGAHCISTWAPLAPSTQMGRVLLSHYDVISFQFGLHDIAYDEERLTLAQYTKLLTNITQHLVAVQRKYGTKLLWVKTTPVPTVATYGFQCNGSATTCLNPARFDRDVVVFNAAADAVMAAANAKGGNISTADLYSFVLAKCGGAGYKSCPGFQLPMNVHFTPEGWRSLAAEMRRVLISL